MVNLASTIVFAQIQGHHLDVPDVIASVLDSDIGMLAKPPSFGGGKFPLPSSVVNIIRS